MKAPLRLGILGISITVIIVILIKLYVKTDQNKVTSVRIFRQQSLPDDSILRDQAKYKAPNGIKLILRWTNSSSHEVPNRIWFKENCPIWDCEGTDDQKLLAKASAVILRISRWSCGNGCTPNPKYPYQYFIFDSHTPAHGPNNLRFLHNLPPDYFDLSMTYRHDSHLPTPYFAAEQIKYPKKLTGNELYKLANMGEKNKLVAWFVSHCKTKSERENYVRELQKYIPIDIYGGCGNKTCLPKGKACHNMVEKNYKFYLSFENSLCKDYVTEKLGHLLNYYIVPIVYGLANYSEVAPPKSVINAMDFSPKQLADYLLELDSNDEKYLQFFKWKPYYRITNFPKPNFCKLCAILHNNITVEKHTNFANWLAGPGICKYSTNPEDKKKYFQYSL